MGGIHRPHGGSGASGVAVKPQSKLWKRYLRIAEKVLLIVKQNEFEKLDFDVQWLEDTVQWIKEKEFITDQQKTAIDNTMIAVKNMVRYQKFKERRLKRGQSN